MSPGPDIMETLGCEEPIRQRGVDQNVLHAACARNGKRIADIGDGGGDMKRPVACQRLGKAFAQKADIRQYQQVVRRCRGRAGLEVRKKHLDSDGLGAVPPFFCTFFIPLSDVGGGER